MVAAIGCVCFGILFSFLLFRNRPHSAVKLKAEIQAVNEKAEEKAYFSRNNDIGGFVGGIAGALFSLAGVFLLFLTLRNQNESGEREKIEARFFELIKLHRENIQELLYRNGRNGEALAEGRRVFKEVYEQILEASQVAEIIFTFIVPEHSLRPELISIIPANRVNQFATISLSYAIVFFGVAKNNDNSTINALKKDFKEDFAKQVIALFKLIPAKYEEFDRKVWEGIMKKKLLTKEHFHIVVNEENEEKISNTHFFESNSEFVKLLKRKKVLIKRFGGHQHKLGHYFRHLFQTVKYIDNQKLLSFNERYEYIKTLRAQLSNYEQYVFFYNSISFVGREWEFNHLSPNDEEQMVISKYNLIKNIPDTQANGINIKSFYPLIDFEFEDPSPQRAQFAREHWGGDLQT